MNASNSLDFGVLSGSATGIILKELVRRAIRTIRAHRHSFEVHVKPGYGGEMNDVCTSADRAAQDIYLRGIRECFPTAGIVAEENDLRVGVGDGCDYYFTIDPLDGTKAFVRRQSTGVGSMVAMVRGGEVISAYVGDVNTQEIYGFRPGSDRVHRISEFGVTSEPMGISEDRGNRSPSDTYVLLRDPPQAHSLATGALLKTAFKNILIEGGSIGIWYARLWKGEVQIGVLKPGWETPWDSTPIIGISKKLGFKFFRPSYQGGSPWEEFDPSVLISVDKYDRKYDIVIVHENNEGLFLDSV